MAGGGAAAVSLAGELAPDVIVMDVRMPGLDGITATRILTGREDPPRVLVLTTFDLDAYVFEALRAGASGFLLKDVQAAELLQGIRVVAAGESVLAPSATRRLIGHYAAGPHAGPRPGHDTVAMSTTHEERTVAMPASETTHPVLRAVRRAFGSLPARLYLAVALGALVNAVLIGWCAHALSQGRSGSRPTP